MQGNLGRFELCVQRRTWAEIKSNLVCNRRSNVQGGAAKLHLHSAVKMTTQHTLHRPMLANQYRKFIAPCHQTAGIHGLDTRGQWRMVHEDQYRLAATGFKRAGKPSELKRL